MKREEGRIYSCLRFYYFELINFIKKKPFQKERLPDLGRRYEKLSFFISMLLISTTSFISLANYTKSPPNGGD